LNQVPVPVLACFVELKNCKMNKMETKVNFFL
jgi:hypothetical protein